MNETPGKPESILNKMSENYKKDKLLFTAIVLILALGIFFRVYQYNAEGALEGDSPGVVAGSLKWYYPHDYFPGLMHTYPPLGNIIFGAGCMLSGADFSPIIQQPQNFYPSIFPLIGEPYSRAEKYCVAPSYLASILLFLGLVVFSFSILDKYSAAYSIAFFAFFGIIIQWGRVIYYDVILWTLTIYGLLFLWRAYKAEKGNKKEYYCFLISAAFFGLATATKYTAVIFLPFAIFIILEKYSFGFFKHFSSMAKINLKTLSNPEKEEEGYSFFISAKYMIMSVIAFLFAMLLPYKFSLTDFFDVKNTFFTFYPNLGKVVISGSFPKFFIDFLFNISLFDAAIAIFSISTFIILLKKTAITRNASNNERFILYLVVLLIVSLTISAAFDYSINSGLGRRLILYVFGLVFLMSLAFSDAEYSIFSALNIKDSDKKRAVFFIFLSIYIVFSAASLFSAAPYYAQTKGPLCKLDEAQCITYPWPIHKLVSDTMKNMLKENETFYGINLHMYLRQKDDFIIWQIESQFQQKYGRPPTITEVSNIFDFEGRHIRYFIMSSFEPVFEGTIENKKEIFRNYEPKKVILINNIEAAYIYDLEDLVPRNATKSRTG
ncbi:glycosyltransferase family 39 protein [archaeon]|nr:glycosyltransferase family 39 protein [Nanoarchaeota archaeon]MBU4452290.1 glycosyltransferase family 39 protein [Nanoarchaeota archaeon]MCG2723815.1 glycosyltransferase family 39 protein [archaeon]